MECDELNVIHFDLKHLFTQGQYNNSEIAARLISDIIEKYDDIEDPIESDMSLHHIDLNESEYHDQDNDHIVKEETKVNMKEAEPPQVDNQDVHMTPSNQEKKNETIQLFNSAEAQQSESDDSEEKILENSDDSSSEKDAEMEEEEIKLSNVSSINEENRNKSEELLESLQEICKMNNLKNYPSLKKVFNNMCNDKADKNFTSIFETKKLICINENENLDAQVKILK